jgi:hypothetical protein
MGDATVRAAVRDWFQTAQIDGLQKVYLDLPWFLDGSIWPFEDGREWAAVAFVHIDTSNESRITVPALTGQKQINYTISLGLHYQYLIPAELGIGADVDDWVVGLDSILDGVKARLREDPNMGAAPNTGPVWQQGQSNADIRLDRDLPILDNGIVRSWNRVEFQLTEIITA